MKKYIYAFAIVICSFLFAPKVFAAPHYYTAFTVTSTTSISSGTLTKYPFEVSSTLTQLEATSSGGHIQNLCTTSEGIPEPCDINFTTSTPTPSGANWSCPNPLNFEPESYSSSTGAFIVWVQTDMKASQVVYGCYGDATVTTDQSHPSSTWDANYVAVYHFPNGTVLNASDSTSNANNGTINSATATTGQIDGAASFDGSTKNIDIPDSTSLHISNKLSVEAWANKSTANQNGGVVAKWSSTPGTRAWLLYNGQDAANSKYQLSVEQSNGSEINLASPNSISTGWNLLSVTLDGSTIRLYENGAAITATSSYDGTIQTASPPNMEIGRIRTSDNVYTFNGSIDEVRVSNINRSSQWILTEYNNQNSPSTFYTVGTEQAGSGGGSSVPTPYNQVLTFDW
jgi:hypothetical protein